MDILCTRCGEPWGVCSLTDDMSPEEARKLKAGEGCPCCVSKEICPDGEGAKCEDCEDWDWKNLRCFGGYIKPRANDARYIQKELAGILGDDIDGLSAMMEDAGLI